MDELVVDSGPCGVLPQVLNTFARHVVHTNPDDVLLWSAKYMSQLSAQVRQSANAAERDGQQAGALMGRFLAPEDIANIVKLVDNSLGELWYADIEQYWLVSNLAPLILHRIMLLGKFEFVLLTSTHCRDTPISCDLFVVLACTLLSVSLTDSLSAAVRLLGGRTGLECERVIGMYLFLCALDPDIEETTIQTTVQYLNQAGQHSPVTGCVQMQHLTNDHRSVWGTASDANLFN